MGFFFPLIDDRLSKPPAPPPLSHFSLCLFCTKPLSTFPIILQILFLINYPSPRCFLTYISPLSRLCSTRINLLSPIASLLPGYQEIARGGRRGGGLLDKKTVSCSTWILGNLMHEDGRLGSDASKSKLTGKHPNLKISAAGSSIGTSIRHGRTNRR